MSHAEPVICNEALWPVTAPKMVPVPGIICRINRAEMKPSEDERKQQPHVREHAEEHFSPGDGHRYGNTQGDWGPSEVQCSEKKPGVRSVSFLSFLPHSDIVILTSLSLLQPHTPFIVGQFNSHKELQLSVK